MVSDDPRPRPTGDAGRQGNRDRRVRFVIIPDVRTLPLPEDNPGLSDRRRQTILPGEDESSRARRAAADPHHQQQEQEGPIRSLDPVLAATRRARFRAEATRMQLLEDTSMPDDLAAAEEDYDEPEELYNEEGIPIEPFHLRAEREAGYFDAEGNYLEYRLDVEDTDAWLESIMDEHHQVRADPELAARRRKAAAATGLSSGTTARGPARGLPATAPTTKGKGRRKLGGAAAGSAQGAAADAAAADDAVGDAEDDDDDLDDGGPYDMHMLEDTGAVLEDDERAVYQKRVADLLQSGETPLDGLRRLGRVMHSGLAAAATSGGGPVGAAASVGVAAITTTTTTTTGPAAITCVAENNASHSGGLNKPDERGGGVHVQPEPTMALSAGLPLGAAGDGVGGGGHGSGDGGTSGSMTQLSCGERQRLKKQRREQHGTEGAGLPQQDQERESASAQEPGRVEALMKRMGKEEDVDGTSEPATSLDGKSQTGGSGEDVEMEDGVGGGNVMESGGSRPVDSPPSPAARQSVAEATAAAATRRRAPAHPLSEAAQEARRQFDLLTSYANLLLSAGMYDVYNNTREQLLRAAQRTLGVDVVRSLTVSGLRPVGPAAPPAKAQAKLDGAAASNAGSGGSSRSGDCDSQQATGKRKRQEREDGAASGGSADGGAMPTSGSDDPLDAAERSVVAVDADMDMFGDGEDADGGAAQAASGPGSDFRRPLSAPETSTAATDYASAASPTSAQGPPGTANRSAGESPAETERRGLVSEQDSAGTGDVRGAAYAAAAAISAGPLVDRGGFDLDPDSGYLYSSQLGYYYDTATGLYGDANTGLWYRYVAAEGSGEGNEERRGERGEEGLVPSGRFVLVTAAPEDQQQQLLLSGVQDPRVEEGQRRGEEGD